MKIRLIALILVLLASSYAAQNSSGDIFTISVAKPTLAKDVQIRFEFAAEPTINGEKMHYFYPGEIPSPGWIISDPAGNKTVVRTGPEPEPALSFKLIAYAPGCQLVAFSADLQATSNRQVQFTCTPLNTIQFSGEANVSAFAGKELQVEVLYGCDWSRTFFGRGPVTPFSLGKANIVPDGSFTISLPDFAADPLWSTVANDASLYFYLVDGANGQRLGALKPSLVTSAKGGPLKVAPSYPQVDFSVQSN
jgi:hypothetical protein